jgi:hypothetical protein
MVQFTRRWVSWACLTILAVGFVALVVWRNGNGASKSGRLYIRIDTNGLATVLGIPLGSSSARDITLGTLGKAHVPITVLVPSGGSGTRAWDTNFGPTWNSIVKAGLIPTNKPSGASPYE